MRKLTAMTFVTLDGVMQAPGAPDEDGEDGFKHGGWQGHYSDEASGEAIMQFMDKPFDLLLGRKTYDIFNAYWPHQKGEIAEKFGRAHKYIASRTLDKVEWLPGTLIKDAAADVTNLKAGSGPDIQIWGSGNLIQTLLKRGLVDEFHVLRYPVLLGRGKKLFEDGAGPLAMEVVDSKVTPKGIVIATYKPAGEVVYMTIGDEVASES
ncbi:MAG: dihydrofolate reductase family protein [Chloroflexota bacterium]